MVPSFPRECVASQLLRPPHVPQGRSRLLEPLPSEEVSELLSSQAPDGR